MALLSLLLMVCVLSGCTGYQDPDFNKPLIVLPQDTDTQQNAVTTQNNDHQQNEEDKPKPLEDKVWIEAKTSKLWVNPFVDENGDLVEGHYKDIVTEQGHWELKPYDGKQ